MPRRLLTALACLLPFAIAPWATARLVERAAAGLGASLAGAAAALPSAAPIAPIEAPAPGDVVIEDSAVVADEADPGERARGRKKPAKVVHGIKIGARAVLRLSQSGVRPSGSPVPAAGDRPAGLALAGVGGLGVGVSDGDVLVDVAGAPARSVGAVVGAVIAARRARAPSISGHVWHRGELWQLVVEQPYPR